ncbi:mannose-6-phosphate isomerase 1-like [Prosopis cineraria]|uniref:mannose-6-phosphate isomerase 1-like n=1 Tax=Prosopis cineraria TaxID=364024 RepID=UPI00240FF9C3|nr:mannose-6-phosphate isomerase 1-like [Prosopis cineraria]
MESEDELQMLRCSVKNYDWGRPVGDSQVARLFSLNSGSEQEPGKPYAEFWMGTHDSGPSFLLSGDENESLKSWLSRNPLVLGEKVLEKWGCDLPFLFKVLSVAKALSIQAHPDKELARTLHKLHPDVYKDGNHKPEMALAITEFEALCGFVSLEELKVVLRTVPEVMGLVGFGHALPVFGLTNQDKEETIKRELAAVFTRLMFADKNGVTESVGKLISRLTKETQVRELTDKEALALRLEKQYPGDIGVIASFLLNYVKLNPGEALCLGPNEPHAYISGECIECMATSDNVVRAGLTPKQRDVQTLCFMLTYKQGPPEILRGLPINPYVTKYLPPFDEFEIDRCILPQGESVTFPAVPGPSIFLVVDGEAIIKVGGSVRVHIVAEGDVFFAAANTQVNITKSSDLILFRAGVNSRFFQASQD